MRARLLALVLFAMPFPAAAATLYFSPGEVTAEAGVPLTMELRADVPDAAVHAAEADIAYDDTALRVTSISHTNSLLTNFSTEPSVSAGTIKFSGWMEHTFTGTRGVLLAITFVPLRTGTTTLTIQSGTLLAAQVQENNVVTGLAPATIAIREHRVAARADAPALTPTDASASTTSTGTTTPVAARSTSLDDGAPVIEQPTPTLNQAAAAGAGNTFVSIPVDYLVLVALVLACAGLGFFLAYLFFRAGIPT